MAHNIARWTARIGLGEQVVTTKTLRRRFFSLAGRITRSARRLTLHLPQRWPWEAQFDRALARLRALHSLPDGGGGNRPPSGQPNVPANSRQSGLRVPLAASSPRYLALTNIRRRSQSLPRQLKTDTGPPLPKSCSDHRPPLSLSPVPLLHSHPFGGFGIRARAPRCSSRLVRSTTPQDHRSSPAMGHRRLLLQGRRLGLLLPGHRDGRLLPLHPGL